MIDPSSFGNKDSAIHGIKLLDIVLLDGNTLTYRGLENPKCDRFWFLVQLYNEGKNSNGKFVPSGYYVKKLDEWKWESHYYLIYSDFTLYHYFFRGDNYYWNLKTEHIIKPFNSPYPALGQKNAIKLKTAIRKGLENWSK